MDKAGHNDYQEHLKSTIQEMYPKYAQRKLLKDLEKLKVINLKKNKTSTEDTILDLSTIEEQEQLTTGIVKRDEVTRHIERDEFLKSYKYAVLFNVSSIEEDTFIQLKESGKIHNFFAKDYSHDIIYDGITYNSIKPTMYTMGNVTILKFSKLLTGYVPGTGTKKQIKYPILAVYLKHLGVLEIRLDQVRTYFQEDDFFYHEQINFILKWFQENIDCDIENINLPPIIEHIGKKDQDEVNVHAQAMSLKSGGKAVLETGLNENYILPLLGELKELIKSNEDLFEKSPEIKLLLDKFISETESTADLPWISLIWKGKNKTKGNIVKFKHNYMNQGYTLLQYYGLQTDMEKMDNVTEYIINNKNEIDS
ncbi:hypothetical protein, partial [Priestia sp. HNGD-A6]